MGGENQGRTTIRMWFLAKNGNGPQPDGNGSFWSEMLYMAPAHGTMSIRVETNYARVKIDEKRGL